MKKMLAVMALVAIVMIGVSGKPLEKEVVPLSYTEWTQWSENDICCSPSLIMWKAVQIGIIQFGGGQYVGVQSEELWPVEKRYRLKYFAVPILNN